MDTQTSPKNKYKRREYLPFSEAREFARSLKLKSSMEWKPFCKSGNKPRNIPVSPDSKYKEQGWIGWKDFLGNVFVPLEEAKQFARNLNIKTYDEWRKYVVSNNMPDNIPSNPSKVYKYKGWISWGDYLGTGNIAGNKRVFRPFIQARQFVRSLKLKSEREWKLYRKSGNKPDDIPSIPERHYKKEWTSWRDFLGSAHFYKDPHLSFLQARKYVRKLKLENFVEWRAYVRSGKRPDFIPTAPDHKYKNKGWKSWGDFLGTFTIGNKYIKFLPFPQARDFARKLKLKKYDEWVLYAHSGKKPVNIPFTPHVVYKNKGWKGYRDFLGLKKYKKSIKKYR